MTVWGCFSASGPGWLVVIEGMWRRLSVRNLNNNPSAVMLQDSDQMHRSSSNSPSNQRDNNLANVFVNPAEKLFNDDVQGLATSGASSVAEWFCKAEWIVPQQWQTRLQWSGGLKLVSLREAITFFMWAIWILNKYLPVPAWLFNVVDSTNFKKYFALKEFIWTIYFLSRVPWR